jgi:hypothetical protein
MQPTRDSIALSNLPCAEVECCSRGRLIAALCLYSYGKVKGMPEDWEEIISFYHNMESGKDRYLVSMEALVKQIIENRDVHNIYPVTSLLTLELSKYRTYHEAKDKPLVSIKPVSATHYCFSLIEPLEFGEIYRERAESISCLYAYALKAYDEMIEKLEKLESDNPREA